MVQLRLRNMMRDLAGLKIGRRAIHIYDIFLRSAIKSILLNMRLDLGPKVLNFAISVKLGILGGREKYTNAEFICKK